MDTKQASRLAALQQRKSYLDNELKRVNGEIRELEEVLLEQAFEDGVDKLTVTIGHDDNGVPIKRTVYLERKVWASPEDQGQLNEGLRQAGLEDYIKETVNTNAISAYVREYDPERNLSPEDIRAKLPEPIRNALKISEVFKLKSRRA